MKKYIMNSLGHISEIDDKPLTAYELATGLENHFKGNFITSESALLLRQQADRIAELEQNLSAYIVELELHKAMIQDLERQLKNV